MEYHQHPNTDFVDLFFGSSRNDSLLAIITTAGVDLNYPCYTVEYSYATKVLSGEIEDDEYFTDICEAEEGDDFESLTAWQKANPVRCSFERGLKDLESACRKAKESEEEMVKFKTKCCDIWVAKKQFGYMNMTKWFKQRVKEIPFDTAGRPCYIGLDLSAKIDLTSVSFVFPYKTDELDNLGLPIIKYYVYTHSFIANEDRLKEKMKTDKQPYDRWIEEGYISLTNSEVVDQTYVMMWVLGKIHEFGLSLKKDVKKFCFDDSNASKFMMDLTSYLNEKGIRQFTGTSDPNKLKKNKIVPVFQSTKSLNEVTKNFRDGVYNGNVFYVKNPVLDMAMFNAIVVTDRDGKIKIDKDAGKNRIDPVDATLFGFKLAQYEDFKGDSSDELDDIYSSWGR